jgi:hypothetical protein
VGESHEDESTEARHWDGSIRTSDEGSVMEPEQRDRIRLLHSGATGNRRKLCVQQSESRTK